MAKTVWLIVSDLHFYYKNISSRVDYVKEMSRIREKIVSLAVEYKQQGCDNVNLLLLGDVFHRSYQNTFISSYDNNFFVMWDKIFGKIFSVIGNHELHYYASNPFFTLVNEIESEKVRGITSDVWTPQGLLPTIRVVDRLEDGNVVFHFNHYGTSVNKPEDGKVNIGLFHQDIITREIIEQMERKFDTNIFDNTAFSPNLSILEGYQYCFFGHMHKAYGIFKTDSGGYLYYLASLGRTNSGEVNDLCLERCIPAVITCDGEFNGITEHKLTLESRAQCLREVSVEEKKQQYELQKLRKEAREYKPLADDPIKSMLDYFAEVPICVDVIQGLLVNPVDTVGKELRAECDAVLGRR